MIKNLLGATVIASVILAATAQSEEVKSYDFKVEGFTWEDTQGCVAVLNGGKLTEVMDGVDKEDCAKVSSVAEVSVNVKTGAPEGMLATFKSPSFDTFVCWYRDITGNAVKAATCNN